MTQLRISDKLTLPIDAVTSTLVVYGGKGMGKTNLASVLVEEFAAAHLRFAVVDPMGVWWGLRHSISGKGAGIELLILGGIHGDLPIEPTSGAIVADLVVDEDASVIVDISRRIDGSMWSIGERVRFVTEFAKRVYQRQGEKRRPLHLVIDEAARFAPQIVRQGEIDVAKCMGAVAVIVEEGRNVGIGVTLVTQRSARLNKDVAELADCMIAFRIVGPNSMRAVLDWLGEHVDKGRLRDISEKLRELPRGSALVVSPGWLEFEGIVAMRKRETFDSSATPKPGERVSASGPGAKPDLAKYRARLAEVVDRAKANDPTALKRRVAELEKLVAAKVPAPAGKVETKVVEKAVLKDAQIKRVEALLAHGDRAVAAAAALADKAGEMFKKGAEMMAASGMKLEVELGQLRTTIKPFFEPMPVGRAPLHPDLADAVRGRYGIDVPRAASVAIGAQRHPHPTKILGERSKHAAALPAGEAAILRALIQYTAGLERRQLTVLTSYKKSTRDAYIARLRERGLVDVQGDRVLVSREGVAVMPDVEPLPTGPALQDYWLRNLPSGEGTILAALIEARGGDKSRDSLSERTGFKKSTRDAYLHRLAAKELVVDAGRGMVRASPTLFEVQS